jgi:hypothetical protein
VLQQQQHKTDERNQDIRVEDDSRISRSKIVLRNDLMDVYAGRAEQVTSRAGDSAEAQLEAAAESEEPNHRETQACETQLYLEKDCCPNR